jgi:type VI secretion system ImpH/TssG family protein
MAAESRRTDPPLKQQLFQEGYRFEFFQAVRLLQRSQSKRQPVGGASRPSDEAVRFRARQSLSFPPSEIYEIREAEAAERPPEMTVAFMGLTGPQGVLPRYYTELMLDRIREKDYTLRDFFDVLNHRLISLFYRAWEKHRIVVGCERSILRGSKDTFADDLFALMGMGTKGLREQLLLPERTLLHYTGLLVSHRHSADALRQCLADYFEAVAGAARNAKAASNWVMGELLRTLNDRGTAVADVPLKPDALAGLIALVDTGAISNAIAKDVFPKMYDSGRSAADIVAAEGLAQNSDESAVLEIVRSVLAANAETVAQYRAGSQKTFGFLVGQVMKGSGGKANPKLANALLKRELDA